MHKPPLTLLVTSRTRVLCLLGVIAIAGCAPRTHAAASTVDPAGVTATAPLATAAPTADAAVAQALNTIDSQLSAVNGQLNEANTGLHSSEGNPAQ